MAALAPLTVAGPAAAETAEQPGATAGDRQGEPQFQARDVPASPSAKKRQPTATEKWPHLLGDGLRYGEAWLPVRIVYDIPAIPVSAFYHQPENAKLTLAVALIVVALMLPTDPSPDVRIQNWVQQELRSEELDTFFERMHSQDLAAGILVILATTLGVGWLTDSPKLQQWGSLMAESMADAQVYHLFSKFLIGREGPGQGSGLGKVGGPPLAVEFFPSGTPSGHAATVCAASAATIDFWGIPALDVVSYAACLYTSVSVIYVNQHYISDVIWGAPMGFFIGRWVLYYRSGLGTLRPPARGGSVLERLQLAPWMGPRGERGLMFGFTW